MSKLLNTNLIKEQIAEYGINQTQLSEKLGVTRQSVSLWLNSETFPRPSELLKLGKLLKLKHSELVSKDLTFEPKVAFRKVASAKTKNIHIKKAKEMGYALETLVEFLPDTLMIKAPELKNPVNKYKYVQSVANLIRNKFEINDLEIKFSEVIRIINSFNAIIIPVLLGHKNNHENAIHIYLPKSQTTWIYINLDTKIFDFKFWLSHELGHILTPSLSNNEAEDFADSFAGAFLFPEERAKLKHQEIIQLKRMQDRIRLIIDTARELFISPTTILKELEKYSMNYKLKSVDVGKNFYPICTNFTKSYMLVSENIFGNQKPSAAQYMKDSKEKFDTIFFDLLKAYNSKNGITSNYIRNILNVPIADAKEIYTHITNASN